MTEAERGLVVETIAQDPDGGVLIPGTGGARKVRVAKGGRGKSAGYRVITYYSEPNRPVLLITVISAGKQANLTQAPRNELRKDDKA
jgi:mRNA-degrading endonuclease RelE of RelBE toxin-antitoxin system